MPRREPPTSSANSGTGRIATGRERCTIAANGAPDCRAAAELLCKSKGFSTGNSLDNETVEKCSALVLLRGNRSRATARSSTPSPAQCVSNRQSTRTR